MLNFEKAGVSPRIIKLYRILIGFMRVIGRIFGLRCVYYSYKSQRFEVSKLDVIYTAVYFIFSCLAITYLMPNTFDGMQKIMPISFVPAMIGSIQTSLNYFLIAFIYFMEMWNSKKIRDYLNNLSEMSEIEESLLKNATFCELMNPWLYLLFKIGICEIMCLAVCLLNFYFIVKELQSLLFLFGTLLTIYPYIVQFTISTFIYMNILRTNFFLKLLNVNLTQIMEKIQKSNVGNMKEFQRITFSCDLSDRLDKFAIYYNYLSTVTKEYINLYSWQLTLMIVSNFLATTFQLFMQYYFSQLQIRGIMKLNVLSGILSFLYCIFGYTDFLLHGIIGHQMKNETKRTGLILHKMPIHQMDIRFRRSIEMFSLQILNEIPGINVSGMFILDLGLISSIIAAISNYIVILIQFDQAI
uniref:Gustatory receptor n=1 Tax=Lutzomyia longipalpis TaxID=7200 RepID=A0A1B0CVG0_LUTLO